jgi:prevent-host-death family protein
MTKRIEVLSAQRILPKLLDLAESGCATIITRNGRPIAVLVPINHVRGHGVVNVASMRGSGKGLWTGLYSIAAQREEWD